MVGAQFSAELDFRLNVSGIDVQTKPWLKKHFFFLEKRKPVLKEKMSLNKKNMVQLHGGAKASAEEGRYTST